MTHTMASMQQALGAIIFLLILGFGEYTCLGIYYIFRHDQQFTDDFFDDRQASDVGGLLVGNKIVDHSEVVGALPVGAASRLHWLQ